jgi:hypothetical protein
LVDLDVVNPYFRSRDVRERFTKEGIEVIAPEDSFGHADLPMISPRIRGAIQDLNKIVILDVGGDPAGCRALGRFVEDANIRGYEMHFVVNTKRPFTSSFEEIKSMKEMLEKSSKLKISEIICNTNLMEFTDVALIKKGIKLIKKVAKSEGLEFNKYLVLGSGGEAYPTEIEGVRKVEMEYFLNKPWER